MKLSHIFLLALSNSAITFFLSEAVGIEVGIGYLTFLVSLDLYFQKYYNEEKK